MLIEISTSLLFIPTHFNSLLKEYVVRNLIKYEKEIKEYWMHICSTLRYYNTNGNKKEMKSSPQLKKNKKKP